MPSAVPGLSAHDYLWNLGQLGHYFATDQGRQEVAEITRPEREAGERGDARDGRYQRQRDLSPLLPESMRACHRKRHTTAGVQIAVRQDGKAGYLGVVSCNSRSGCEHCGPRLLARDAELVNALVEDHGYDRTLMATFTVRHHRGMPLRPMRRGVANAFRRMLSHRDWRTCEALAHVEIVRALEVTDGASGWHPHLHVLLLLEAALSDEAKGQLEAMLARLWRDCVVREMGAVHRPTLAHGVDVSRCQRADYLAKLGLEIADAGQAKRARNVKGRTYWQLSREWIARGKHCDDAQADRIREYIDGMHGAKVVTWGPGLKARAEALVVEPDNPIREAAFITRDEWDCLRDLQVDGRDARAALLSVAELADEGQVDAAVRALVDELWSTGPP